MYYRFANKQPTLKNGMHCSGQEHKFNLSPIILSLNVHLKSETCWSKQVVGSRPRKRDRNNKSRREGSKKPLLLLLQCTHGRTERGDKIIWVKNVANRERGCRHMSALAGQEWRVGQSLEVRVSLNFDS